MLCFGDRPGCEARVHQNGSDVFWLLGWLIRTLQLYVASEVLRVAWYDAYVAKYLGRCGAVRRALLTALIATKCSD